MNVFLFLKGELRQSKGVFFGLTVLLALALAVAVSVIQTERMVSLTFWSARREAVQRCFWELSICATKC